MVDTPTDTTVSTGETATPVAPSNDQSTTSTPQGQSSDPIVEAAKKEAEQARMRAAQLENQLKKVQEAQAEADRKQLEEKEEFKTLYETEKERADRLEAESQSKERASLLATETDNLFKDYPANVVEVAKTAGITLTDDSEAAKNALKEKLDSLASKVGSPTATSNNPAETAPAPKGEDGRLGRPRTLGVDDGTKSFVEDGGKKFGEYVKNIPAIQTMKQQAGYPTE